MKIRSLFIIFLVSFLLNEPLLKAEGLKTICSKESSESKHLYFNKIQTDFSFSEIGTSTLINFCPVSSIQKKKNYDNIADVFYFRKSSGRNQRFVLFRKEKGLFLHFHKKRILFPFHYFF